ncbi:micrococcal nuclease [Mycetocola sp. CAN_C7]|uniref:thermonuclease family protein n=1 Tax=Mycetocola sp. CAN_C7 TaxID=2787724 RepID=UPI0018C94C1F
MLRRLMVLVIAGVLAIGALLAYSSGFDLPIPGPGTTATAPPAPPSSNDHDLPTAPGSAAESATVVRVVDGDTLVIDRGNGDERVRLVGVDTPETVAPNSPVECFGPEASAYLTGMLTGASVRLDADPSQADADRYGRLLRYVWVADETGSWVSVEALLLAGGYAEPYRDAHSRKAGFDAVAAESQAAGRGLWSACP